MDTARLSRVIAVAASVLAFSSAVFAQQTPDIQGLIRERDEKNEQLRQDDKERTQRELLQRQQDESAARQRLESGRIERMQAPSILLPGAPPNLSSGVTMPGFTDRAAEQSRDDASRRDRLNYDSAVRARDDAERAARDATGRAAPWKPIGAR
jgi:hypothetical protein